MLALDGFVEVSPMLQCAVYALAKDGVVIYVGQSKKPLARIAAHRAQLGRKSTPDWMPIRGVAFDQIFLRPCRPEDLNALEAEMINLYKPRLNVRVKNRLPIASAFNLRMGDFTLQINRPTSPFERRI